LLRIVTKQSSVRDIVLWRKVIFLGIEPCSQHAQVPNLEVVCFDNILWDIREKALNEIGWNCRFLQPVLLNNFVSGIFEHPNRFIVLSPGRAVEIFSFANVLFREVERQTRIAVKTYPFDVVWIFGKVPIAENWNDICVKRNPCCGVRIYFDGWPARVIDSEETIFVLQGVSDIAPELVVPIGGPCRISFVSSLFLIRE
jgi:hypothetical protein